MSLKTSLLSTGLICRRRVWLWGIGDFQVAFRLCFKASPWCGPFHMEISFVHTQMLVHLRVNKTNFNMKGFALGLALKQRRKATRKSLISFTALPSPFCFAQGPYFVQHTTSHKIKCFSKLLSCAFTLEFNDTRSTCVSFVKVN